MNKTPERLTISPEREEKIKKKYGYSKVTVYSPSFLSDYIEKIASIFPDPVQQETVRQNMSQISEFIIGDRFNAGLGRLCCSSDAIHMEESLADITDSSFSIKEGHEYLETIFIHELLHAAARQNQGNLKNLTGVLEFERNEKGEVVGRKNVGLNEGITQLLAEKISGQTVPDEIDSYAFNKKVVALLADVLGSNVITSSYFGHTDELKNIMNALANNPEYYDKFNKKLDTINKLETTIRKIKRGQISPKDPESLARMEAVVAAQKEALMESVFADIIIPQIAKKDVKERQNILINLSMHHSSVLKTVQKYIPNIQNTPNAFEDMSDERLAKMRLEIGEYGIDFGRMQEAAKRVNDGHKLGPRIAADFIEAVDSFYDENAQALKADRSSTLTPLLRSQLEGFVDKLDVLEAHAVTEQDKENVEGFKKFLKAYFHKVPDLDAEIAKIREERKAKKNAPVEKKEEPAVVEPKKEPVAEEKVDTPPVHSPEVEEILEGAKKVGEDLGRGAVHSDGERKPEEMEPSKKRTLGIEDDFVVNNVTGEIIDQRNEPIYNRVRNKAQATGDFDLEKEPAIQQIQTPNPEYLERYIANLTPEQGMIIRQQLGPNWREVLQQSYEAGYKKGLGSELTQAKNEGLEQRGKTEERINAGETIESPMRSVSLEEVRFVYENFDIQSKEDGTIEVVDKVTGQVVTNKATVTKALFAREWVNAAGAVQKEDGTIEIHPELAFSTESKDIYRFMQAQAGNDLRLDGAINLPELTANAQAMGGRYETVSKLLFRNPEVAELMDSHFRMQTPDAKSKTEAPQVEALEEAKGTHR